MNCVVRSRSRQSIESEKRGEGILSGKTLLLKDNISIKGEPLTCASHVLEGYVAPYHATAVQRILDQGGLILGQANQDEFAMGSSTEYSAFGPARNPFDETRVTGGSSGGPAASVAAGLVDMALGSDTGGSVRQPGSFCGVYGLKPTYGRVSRYGLVAFASSFDQIGPIAKTVESTAKLFVTIAGNDPKDATSSSEPVPELDRCLNGEFPQKIGVPRNLLKEGVNPEILEKLKELEKFSRDQGIKIVDIELPHCSYSIAAYYILTMAEASSNLARFDGIRYGYRNPSEKLQDLYNQSRSQGFGPEVKRRIMLGTYVLSSGYYDAYYAKAQKVRRLIKEDFVNAFKAVDLILIPTAPGLPFKIGENVDDPLAMYLSDIFTIPMSLAGVPALNIPAGNFDSGLPIGLQVVGDYFREETIFSFSRMVEQNNIFNDN